MISNQLFITIRPLLKLGQILGFCTFSSLQKQHNFKLKYVYPILLIIVYFIAILFCINNDIKSPLLQKDKLITILSNTISVSYLIIIWSHGIVYRKQHIKLVSELNKYEKMYRGMFGSTDYRKTRGWNKRHILASFVTPLIIVIELWFQKEHFKEVQIVTIIILNLPTQIGFFINPIILTYIHIIQERSNVLNRKVRELNFAPRIMSKINISVIQVQATRLKKITTVKYISNLHRELSEEIRLLCDTFGIVFLAWFSLMFIHVVFNAHFIYIFNVSTLTRTLVFMQAMVIGAHGIFICHICHNTTIKVNKMALLIHDIQTDDPRLTDEIEMFLLQMANEKVDFTAGGFFPINYELLFSMTGGALTYIIILYQL